MKTSLKLKFFCLFLALLFTNFIIGGVSLYNLFKVENNTSKLTSNNYASIKATNKMIQIIDEEAQDIISYINSKNPVYIRNFYDTNNSFHENFTFQSNNATEEGEKVINENINKSYSDFLDSLTSLIEIRDSKGKEAALNKYTSEIQPLYEKLNKSLRDISEINDKAMTDKKDSMNKNIESAIKMTLGLSLFLILVGLALSLKYINRFLNPLYSLHDDIIKAKEGDFTHRAEILTDDEIGILAEEFNNMSEKINQFQHSTFGKLLDEKNRSMTIIKSISDPIIVLDTNYRIVLLNDEAENYFRITQAQATGRHVLETLTYGELFDFISNVMDNNIEKDSKIMSFKNNSTIFKINLSKINDNMNKTNGIVVYFQNITEIKKVEKLKHDLISSLSHEIKTPLTSIMMGASLLEDSEMMESNKNFNKIVSAISEDSQKLLNLINNFLRYGQLESDQKLLNMDFCSAYDIINRSVEEYYSLLENKNIELRIGLQDNLPELHVDEEKIGWVLNNLMSNAIKYTKNFGSVLIGAYENNGYLSIFVKDTGIGITNEYQTRIFEKFFRANSESDGTGLGLALSKQIVELHGGNIYCESQYGLGSTFTFELPIRED
ncbi:ATP-binding protein [Clostridium sp. C8-1-8]|uniref:sensor histidine kinase n=1 Tax=Clostridium sp. C8-1-8 TaxID=2698831 RepID=UPI00136F6CD8|nr:ATP-binding protein [Clostridium sp. C8-1-8]